MDGGLFKALAVAFATELIPYRHPAVHKEKSTCLAVASATDRQGSSPIPFRIRTVSRVCLSAQILGRYFGPEWGRIGKSDRRRVCLCAGGLRKVVHGMHSSHL